MKQTNKTFCSLNFFFSSRCNVIRGPGNCLIYGQRRASCPWQRGMCKPGLPSVWDPAWKSLTSSDECGTVQTPKELAVVSAWHCPRYNLLKVHLCCSRVALWPLCSFCPLKASSLFLLLPPPRYCFWSLRDLNCVLWRSRIFGALWGNVQIFSFALKPMPDLG